MAADDGPLRMSVAPLLQHRGRVGDLRFAEGSVADGVEGGDVLEVDGDAALDEGASGGTRVAGDEDAFATVALGCGRNVVSGVCCFAGTGRAENSALIADGVFWHLAGVQRGVEEIVGGLCGGDHFAPPAMRLRNSCLRCGLVLVAQKALEAVCALV